VIKNYLSPRKKNLHILTFGVSVLWAVSVLVLERLIGIDASFHPDSLYYLDPQTYSEEMLFKPNDGYIVFIRILMGYSANSAIGINILAFSLTNYVIARIANFKTWKEVFLFLLLSPYRSHLAVHPLKDSLVILFVILGLVASLQAASLKRRSTRKVCYILLICAAIIPGTLLRSIFAAYLLPLWIFYVLRLQEIKINSAKFSRFAYSWLLIFLVLVALGFTFKNPEIFIFLQERSDLGDMGGRFGVGAYDFSSFGFPLSGILKSLLWPLMAILPSAFIWLSPSSAMISIDYNANVIKSSKTRTSANKVSIFISFYIISFSFGLLVSAYTAYARYMLPLSLCLYLVVGYHKVKCYRQKDKVVPN
jgi:hypothetical protein